MRYTCAATEKCIGTLNDPIFEDIENCHSSAIGENILKSFGDRTDNLDPSPYFIPWITIDNVSTFYKWNLKP